MSCDPNEPRAMKARGNSADPRQYDNATGDAGHDGFTRIARRDPNPHDVKTPWGTMTMPGSREINPPIGEPEPGMYPMISED